MEEKSKLPQGICLELPLIGMRISRAPSPAEDYHVHSNKEPPNLEEAIEIAEQVGAGKYYGKNKIEREKTQERKLEDDIDQLIQKMQQISLSYASLTSVLAAQETSAINPLDPLELAPITKVLRHENATIVVNADTWCEIVCLKEVTEMDILMFYKIEDNKESDGMENLLVELEFEEEELQECETYYSE
ncbi:22969_t:CDS:2 [Gigaspora rosea]|nr:22969_t:CDS:2 [Gigaspora rosea]